MGEEQRIQFPRRRGGELGELLPGVAGGDDLEGVIGGVFLQVAVQQRQQDQGRELAPLPIRRGIFPGPRREQDHVQRDAIVRPVIRMAVGPGPLHRGHDERLRRALG